MAYAGPFCKQHHITSTMLLEGTKPMPSITAVTNGLVLELYGVMQGNKLTWEAMKKWGISLIRSELVADVSTSSQRHAVMRVVNHRKTLIKSKKKEQLDTYLKCVLFPCQYPDHLPAALPCPQRVRNPLLLTKPAGEEW